jgi:uncharacterized SAM-binding protein YcdF (DUF218 family)
MMPDELKPILTALALPPAGPLLLALLGVGLLVRRRVRAGSFLALVGLTALWILSCHAPARMLAQSLLPQVPPARADQLARVDAIVVLGGGVLAEAPEYGAAQPNSYTLARLRYGAMLARRTGKPLAFAGGVGWAAARSEMAPEAQVARQAAQDLGVSLRWAESNSRDTVENAQEMRRVMLPQGVRRIALVTDSWHMPRAVLAFERAGFEVVPAPTGFPAAQTRLLLRWLPSTEGLTLSRQVLREALALQLAR